MTDKIWKKGTMTFTDQWTKPPKMSFDEWVKQDKGRTWVSKSGETPSDFIARILRDMPIAVRETLLADLKKGAKA